MEILQKDLENFGKNINFIYLDKDQIILDNDACWEWVGSFDKKRFGRFNINKKTYLPHRLSYMIDIGDIPIGVNVQHTCDNHKCVNPNHLYLDKKSDVENCDFSKSDLNRFNKTVNFVYLDKDKTSLNHKDCWDWTGTIDKKTGYGKIGINNKSYLTHRIAYMIENGKIPSDMYVCHSCDNPPCVNPNHLWLGTPDDDVQDKVNKNRQFMKLTVEDITEILSGIYNDKYINISQITEVYDISENTIKSILMGESRTNTTYHITNKLDTSLQNLYEKIKYNNKSKPFGIDDLLNIHKNKIVSSRVKTKSPMLTEKDIKDILIGIHTGKYITPSKIWDDYFVDFRKILKDKTWESIISDIIKSLNTTLEEINNKISKITYRTNLYKLDASKVHKIKRLLKETDWTQKDIADYFDITITTVNSIKSGLSWPQIQ